MSHNASPSRRRVLAGLGGLAAATSLAGCAGILGQETNSERPEGVVLDPPPNYDKLKDVDLPHPTYGERLPSVTLPAPLQDQDITTPAFEGERHTLTTFIYTSCMSVCVELTAALRHVQADSIDEGYAEDIAFFPTTFDPAYDTPDALRSYGEDHGVNRDFDSWYFLRPESEERAKAVVEDTFGVPFEYPREQATATPGGTATPSDHSMDDGDHGDHRMLVHAALILLANKDGIVERAYTGGSPGKATLLEDTQTLIGDW